MLLYLVNYIDRLNVAFAALTMNKDLGFTPDIFGFGAGIFFIGYVLFQVPSTLLLERVGARRLIFGILAIWGLISASNAFVQGPLSFYALRVLLGIAEAGFVPGMVFYLTLWFPAAYRGRFTAMFMTAIPLSGVIGGPLSGLILGMDGVGGLHGWQWLFLMEGIPAFILAFAALKFLPDGPWDAAWLSSSEKAVMASRRATEASTKHSDLLRALRDPRVLTLGLVNFGIQCGNFGTTLWLPQIVQTMGFSNTAIGFVVVLPYGVAAIAMIVWGRSSDVRNERIWHVALPLLLAAMGLAAASVAQANLFVLAALTLALAGILSALGPFWSLPSSFLGGAAAAGGIGLVNAIATLGGFVGPTIVGVLKEQTGGYSASMAALAIGLVLSAAIVLALPRVMAARNVQVA